MFMLKDQPEDFSGLEKILKKEASAWLSGRMFASLSLLEV
jgi:hypothetical protein